MQVQGGQSEGAVRTIAKSLAGSKRRCRTTREPMKKSSMLIFMNIEIVDIFKKQPFFLNDFCVVLH